MHSIFSISIVLKEMHIFSSMIISKKDACRYVDELGWVIHSLEGKTPLLKKWNAAIDVNNCKSLLSPNMNVGVLTGSKSGIVVFDADKLKDTDDTSKYADGVNIIDGLFQKYGEPLTVKAQTGGGGYHYYFKYDERMKLLVGGNAGAKTKSGKSIKWDFLSDTMDMKSQNAVLPPSVHPVTQKAYKWVRSPFDYDVLDMPEWLFNLIKKRRPVEQKRETYKTTFTTEDVEARLQILSDEKRSSTGYNDWIKVGMVLKGCAIVLDNDKWGFDLWDNWSYEGDSYDESIMKSKWDSFSIKRPDWSYGALCNMAKEDSPVEYKSLFLKRPVSLSPKLIGYIFEGEPGHAKIICEIYKNEMVCINPSNGSGYVWNTTEKLWVSYEECELLHVITTALENVVSTHREAVCKDPDLSQETKVSKDRILTDILNRKVRSGRHIREVSRYIRGHIRDLSFYEKLDNSPSLLPIKGGNVLDLKTGYVRVRTIKDMFTFECDVELGDGIFLEKVEEFMTEIMGTKERARYLQTLCGLFLTGEVSDRMIFILWGPRSTGKSVFTNLLARILGKYYSPIAKEVFIKTRGADRHEGAHSSHLIQTIGKRVGSFSETKQGDKLNEGLIKALTGGDAISARPAFGKHNISFRSGMKPVLLTNFKPTFDTQDAAIVERIRFVPFETKFEIDPKMPNEKKRDDSKVDKIFNEYLPDVLKWMVEGSIRYYKEGLVTPACLEEAKAKYVAEVDTVAQFVSECLEFDAECTEDLKMTECHAAFIEWCSENQEDKINNKAMIESLRNKGFTFVSKQRAMYLKGCRLVT